VALQDGGRLREGRVVEPVMRSPRAGRPVQRFYVAVQSPTTCGVRVARSEACACARSRSRRLSEASGMMVT
jgi:hypothetical protein